MNEPELIPDIAEPEAYPRNKISFWREELPYIAVLILALLGVAYTGISHQTISGFWEFLAITIGVVCVLTEWPNVEDRKARFRLVWTQALHWTTFLVIMNITLLPGFQNMIPAPANSLVLLMLLALGTFLAGVNLLSLKICFLGLAMALLVPAISWLKQAALFLTLTTVLIVGLAITFWPRRRKRYEKNDM